MEPDSMVEIRRAIEDGDGDRLESCVSKIATFCYRERASSDVGCFSDELIGLIVGVLECDKFLGMLGSYHLLLLIESDWALLSDAQQKILLAALEKAFPKFRDWMSCFVIAELMGEYYGGADGLAALCRLMNVKGQEARSLVPMGLWHVFANAQDNAVALKALSDLYEMANDSSDQVRSEALMFIERSRQEGGRKGG